MTQPVSYYSASVAITQQKQRMKGRVILAHDLNNTVHHDGGTMAASMRGRDMHPLSACPRGLVI